MTDLSLILNTIVFIGNLPIVLSDKKGMRKIMDAFESFIAENSEKKFYVITPGGNPGDFLIHKGLIKKLKNAEVKHICVSLEEMYKKIKTVGVKYLLNIAAFKAGINRHFKLFKIPKKADIVLFDGGGYMNDFYYGLILLKEILQSFKRHVIIAPNSYWFDKTNFKKILTKKQPITLFCREKYSLDLLLNMDLPENVDIRLSKDTSLYLTRDELVNLVLAQKEYNSLICFRKDKESVIPRKARLWLVKKVIEKEDSILVTDIAKWKPFEAYVSAVANSNKVYTDRLHVAILAHIFGKDFTLFSNCYHKNKGVFEYSLRENPKAKFVELSEWLPIEFLPKFNVGFKRSTGGIIDEC